MTIGEIAARGLGGPDSKPAAEALKTKKAAQDFEALLVSQMLQAALKSGGGAPEGADSTMFEMGEQYLAEAITKGGGLGLSGLIEKQLSPESGFAQSPRRLAEK